MEGVNTLRELVRQDNWLTKVDLKDAYFTIPIHTSRGNTSTLSFNKRQLPTFRLQTDGNFPTGARSEIGSLYRRHSITGRVQGVTTRPGSRTGVPPTMPAGVRDKSVLEPTQSLEFLSLTVDTVAMDLRLPGSKMKTIRGEARKLE